MNTLPQPTGAYQVFPYAPDDNSAPVLFLLPPQYQYPPGAPVSLQIALLWTGQGDLTQSFGNADFHFSFVAPQSGATPANVYVRLDLLTNANQWKTDTASRQALLTNFVSFLQQLESQCESASQQNPTPTLVPGATFRIGQQIAGNLPAPLAETLFYRYSLASGFPPYVFSGAPPKQWPVCVDLRPGMRLRVETEAMQFTGLGQTATNVYVGSGRFEYYLSSVPNPLGKGPRQVVFDPLLGALKTPNLTGSTPLAVGGLFDLQPPGGLRTYWRLFYPATFPPPGNVGNTSLGNNVALIGAATLAELNQATTDYPNPKSLAAVFLGRAVAVPEIPVWLTVNGQTALQYVSLGTTIAQLVERFAPAPFITGQQIPLTTPPQLVTVNRPQPFNQNEPNGETLLTYTALAPAQGTTLSTALYDVPLIAGDSVTLALYPVIP